MAQRIRLIASDMDGTLLGADMRVDPAAARAVARARAAGIGFIAVTGRSIGEARPLLDEAGIRGVPVACMNGCELRGPSDELVASCYQDPDCARAVVEAAAAAGVYAEVYAQAGILCASTEEQVLRAVAAKLRHFRPAMTEAEVAARAPVSPERAKLVRFGSAAELVAAAGGIGKITVFWDEPRKVEEFRDRLAGLPVRAETSFPINAEVVPERASKRSVLEEHLRRVGVRMGEVLAIGDAMNDVPMFRAGAACAVAMGNAEERVRAAADVVAPANTAGGVAWAIERLALGEREG